MKEHKSKLNESIKFLEELYKPPSLDETEFTKKDCYMKDQLGDDSKFEQLLLRYSDSLFELQKQSCLLIFGIRSTEEGDKTLHQTIKYLNESIEKQSGSEKALDMKMLEHFLAKGAMSTGNCTTFECENKILEKTQNPHLCLETNEWYFEERSLDGCHMKFAHYDKSICKEKFSESDKKQECLENAEKKLETLR